MVLKLKKFVIIIVSILTIQEIFLINADNKKIFAEHAVILEKYYGDINKDGKVDLVDEQMLIKIVNGISSVTDDIKERCDLNGDGKITNQDVDLMRKYNAHDLDYFPVEPIHYGDIDLNGQITISDLSAVIDAVTHPFSNAEKKIRADLNGDGVVNEVDCNLFANYLSGNIKYFPVQNMLKEIQIKTKPSKLQYNIGENINTAGMVVEAYYNNGYHRIVNDWTLYGNTNTVGNTDITISYSEEMVFKTATYAINVQDIILKEIKIDVKPNKLNYTIGEEIDTMGMIVKAYYTDGTYKEISDVDISGNTRKIGNNKVTVSYSEKGITKTTYYTIVVQEHILDVESPDLKPDNTVNTDVPNNDIDITPEETDNNTKPDNVDLKLDVPNINDVPDDKDSGIEDTSDKTESNDTDLNNNDTDLDQFLNNTELLPSDIGIESEDVANEIKSDNPPLENDESNDSKQSQNSDLNINNIDDITKGSKDKKESTIYTEISSYKKTYGSKAFYLNADTDGDGQLQYLSHDKNIVSVDFEGKVLINGYGKTTITVTMPETDTYKEAVKNISVKIIPKKTQLKTIKTKKHGELILSWKKIKKGLWYEVSLSMDKKFKKSSIQQSTKKTKITLNYLKKKQFYYVRVRAYKKLNGKSYYSGWSSVKKIKTK